jgi:hypothetical protein
LSINSVKVVNQNSLCDKQSLHQIFDLQGAVHVTQQNQGGCLGAQMRVLKNQHISKDGFFCLKI